MVFIVLKLASLLPLLSFGRTTKISTEGEVEIHTLAKA